MTINRGDLVAGATTFWGDGQAQAIAPTIVLDVGASDVVLASAAGIQLAPLAAVEAMPRLGNEELPPTVERKYIGNQRETAAELSRESAMLARAGYTATAQAWVPGTRSRAVTALIIVLCVVVVGLVLGIALLLATRPPGTLTATFVKEPADPTAAPTAASRTIVTGAARQTSGAQKALVLVGLAVLVIAAAGVYLFRDRLPGNVNELAVGDCFDDPSGVIVVTDIQHRPCGDAHGAEVVYVGELPEGSFPGDAALQSFVRAHCVPAFNEYTGLDFDTDPGIDMGYYVPTSSGWGLGDRGIICYSLRADGAMLSESLRRAQ